MVLILLLLRGSRISSTSCAADSLLLLLGLRGRSVSRRWLLGWGDWGSGLLGLLLRLLLDWLWLRSWGLWRKLAFHASCKGRGTGQRVNMEIQTEE